MGCGDSKEASKVAVGEFSSPATAAETKPSAHFPSLQSERDNVREGGGGGGGGGGAGGYEANVNAADDYPGMAKGVEMLVRDQFTSKYSKERMCKWRHATIRAVFPPYGLRINFTGWKDKHDIQLDLGREEDRRRIAPLSLLPDFQMKSGASLGSSQFTVTMDFLYTGLAPSEPPKVSSLTELVIPTTAVKEGDTVDVQDIFAPDHRSKETPGRKARQSSRWRKGVVKEVAGSRVRIHYVGYEDDWDEVVDMDVEPDRIRQDNSHRASQMSSPVPGRAATKGFIKGQAAGTGAGAGAGAGNEGNTGTGTGTGVVTLPGPRRRSLGATAISSKALKDMVAVYEITPNKYGGGSGSGGQEWNTPPTQGVTAAAPAAMNLSSSFDSIADPGSPSGPEETPYNSLTLAPLVDSTTHSNSNSFSSNPTPSPSLGEYHEGEENPFALDRSTPSPKTGKYKRRSPSVRYSARRRQSFPAPANKFHEDAFAERMSEQGLHVVEMEPDGNCLFRAVAHQVYLDPGRHTELRETVCDHMRTHRERFAVFCTTDYDAYLKHMRIDGTWADDLEIRALEEVLDRIFVIYSSEDKTGEPLSTNFEEEKILGGTVQPLKLSYHGQSHYNSIFDERKPLPHAPRNTQTLLKNRLDLA